MRRGGNFIGSVLILSGTIIGAGMLALPIVCAGMGFVLAAFVLSAVCAIMLVTGLLTLEVNLAFKPYRNHFGSMAAATLGRPGKVISWIMMLLLLYALTAAYISGNAALLEANLAKITPIYFPDYLSKFIVTIALGSIVCWSIKVVDFSIRAFLSVKGVLLILAISVMLPRIDWVQLISSGSSAYIFTAIPILVTSFGFHPTIPSITNYLGQHKPKQLVWVIMFGALLPLLIYLIWIFVVLGIVPITGSRGFATFADHGDSLTAMLVSISALTRSHWVGTFINGFSDIAMTTSFLGVTLGLFDFLADGFKRADSVAGRIQTGIVTFGPPLLFTIIYPKGFVYALGYASFFAAILVIIMPALMAYKVRTSKTLKSPLRVFGGTWLLGLMVLIGIVVIILEILFNFNLLPVLGATT